MITKSNGYQWIKQFYGDRCTKRSGVPLINHIDEGIEILNRIGAADHVKEAFAIHPLIQTDTDLKTNFHDLINGWSGLPITASVIALALEYRNIANAFLSNKIDTWDGKPVKIDQIRLSPLGEVNEMLIADKVQNRKDFLRYHRETHPRSLELAYYFECWLEALSITEEHYQALVKGL